MKSHISKRLRTGLALLATCALAGAAQADTVFTFPTSASVALPGSEVVGLVNSSGNPFGVYAGRYTAQIGPTSGPSVLTNIFCVDFTHDIELGDTYSANTQHLLTSPAATKASTDAYYNGGLASALNGSDYNPSGAMAAAQRASEVAYLADSYLNATSLTFTSNFSGSTDLGANLAAVSLSIWDIVQDGANGLGTGGVRLWNPGATNYDGYSASVYSQLTSLTGYYENQAAQHSTYQSSTATWIQAPRNGSDGHYQDYVMEAGGVNPHGPAAVPEPGSLAPMLFGVGGLAALAITRRRKTTRLA